MRWPTPIKTPPGVISEAALPARSSLCVASKSVACIAQSCFTLFVACTSGKCEGGATALHLPTRSCLAHPIIRKFMLD